MGGFFFSFGLLGWSFGFIYIVEIKNSPRHYANANIVVRQLIASFLIENYHAEVFSTLIDG